MPSPTRRTTRLSRLLDRVTERRLASAPETERGERADHEQRIRVLEERIDALEALLEALQDSVHREAVRRMHEFEEINRKLQPAKMARALEEHAREHGL
jgi:flagellar motility protein MotE (MotC chaperone)